VKGVELTGRVVRATGDCFFVATGDTRVIGWTIQKGITSVMASDNTAGNWADRSKDIGPAGRDGVGRFRQLCYELLQFSTKGLLRRDFLPMVTERIKEHSGCDVTELWVKDDAEKHFRCSVTDSIKMPFGFILVPCPLGEETTVSTDGGKAPTIEELCCSVVRGDVDKSHPCLTDRGSYWTTDASDVTSSGDFDAKTFSYPAMYRTGPYKSISIIPIRIEGECIGVLQLKSRKKRYFSAHDIDFYEDISEVLGVALSHQYAQIELRERIKELTCLYGIAQVVGQPGASFDEVIQNIVNRLPSAWLFPEITCARIVLNDRSFVTGGFQDSPYRQTSDIIVQNERVGFVEVAYLEKRLTLDEGPFLAEERNLIDSVAREVAIYYERAKAEEENVSLQEQLRHADRLATIGQLAAGVAHELNEPLGNILGFAQLAKKSEDLPMQVGKDLKNIESASLNAREIIKKLMTFARQFPPKKALVNINDIVTDSIHFFEGRCLKAGIRVVCRLANDLPKITVDPGQINQVLVNLVVNAIQAMPDGGVLTVETRVTSNGIYLGVEDTGTGISEDITNRIFLPFFTTKDINEGTGLGLAVVHGIVASHGGTITVESESGKGTRFQVQLPSRNSERLDEANK
jgi:signal transduction histidine kinase